MLNEVALFHKYMNDAETLRSHGFTVNVEVCRLPDELGKSIKELYNAMPREKRHLLKLMVKGGSEPMYVLRQEHLVRTMRQADNTAGLAEGDDYYNVLGKYYEVLDKLRRDNYINPHGGYTTVEVTTPSGMVYKGESHCHIKDMFNRKTARNLAFEQVSNKMYEAAGLATCSSKDVDKALSVAS